MKSYFKSRSKGFTLIELLVVISIIGLLSSVVLVSVTQARMSGRDASRAQGLREVRSALELYYSTNKSYPSSVTYPTVEDLVKVGGPLNTYLKSLPANFAVTGATSAYSSNGAYYSIFSRTEKGGQFFKNNGCNATDFSTYDAGTKKTYCYGNNPSVALGTGSGGGVTPTVSVSTNPTSNGEGDWFNVTWTNTGGPAICSIYSSDQPGSLPEEGDWAYSGSGNYLINIHQEGSWDYSGSGYNVTVECQIVGNPTHFSGSTVAQH